MISVAISTAPHKNVLKYESARMILKPLERNCSVSIAMTTPVTFPKPPLGFTPPNTATRMHCSV